jgi:hypothetical protein
MTEENSLTDSDWAEWNPSNLPGLPTIPKYETLPVWREPVLYQDIPALSWSRLRRFVLNPSYYRRNPEWKIESSGFEAGNFFHRMILEREKWEKVYATFEAPVNPKTEKPYKSGAAYDKALEEFESQGFIGVPQEAFDALSEIEIAVKESALAEFLDSPYREVEVVSEIDGVPAKGKIDIYSERFGIIDLKTTGRLLDSCGNDKMYWNCRDYGYFDELAYFSLVVEASTGYLPPCSIVAIQIAPPYQVGLYEISGETIGASIDRIRDEYLPRWKEFNASDSLTPSLLRRFY